MKKVILSLGLLLQSSILTAAVWSGTTTLLTGLQVDYDHNYQPVLTFASGIANSSCQLPIHGEISTSIVDYKDLLSIANLAFVNKKNVEILHDGCSSRGYVTVVGIMVKQLQ
ncbi:MAG: hypothetical protein Tsb002_10570 [Wenzhouxiangellaceae bacterium]